MANPNFLVEAARIDPSWTLRLLVRGSRLLRKLGLKAVVGAARRRASLDSLARPHLELTHKARLLACHAAACTSKQDRRFVRPAVEVCTACRVSMADLLELADNELNVC